MTPFDIEVEELQNAHLFHVHMVPNCRLQPLIMTNSFHHSYRSYTLCLGMFWCLGFSFIFFKARPNRVGIWGQSWTLSTRDSIKPKRGRWSRRSDGGAARRRCHVTGARAQARARSGTAGASSHPPPPPPPPIVEAISRTRKRCNARERERVGRTRPDGPSVVHI